MFRDTLVRYLSGVSDAKTKMAVEACLEAVFDRMASVGLTISTPVISSGSAVTAKMGAADSYLVANGILIKIAASTTLPVLTGINAGANQFNIACFFVDQGGTVTALGGTPGATLAATKFPQFPKGKALVAFLLITNGASVFTGNTTALDTATTIYMGGNEGFDPYCLAGSFLP